MECKMDRRKKRTSSEQYQMYIDMMEADPIFATGRVPRDYDLNYLAKKWKELSDRLNKCNSGPTLTPEEWRKRLNDWKNTTRCKYRRSLMSSEKDISMTTVETRALDLFGKVPAVSGETLLNLKSEKHEIDDEMEEMGQRTSASFQKELQAAVEEAINDEVDEDEMVEEHVDHEDMLEESLVDNAGGLEGATAATTAVNTGGGTYRTIVVDNTSFEHLDEEQPAIVHPHPVEFVTTRRTAASVVSPSMGPSQKLINGELPVKRMRTQARDQIIYEVKNAPRITSIQSAPPLHNTKLEREAHISSNTVNAASISSSASSSAANTLTHALSSHDAQQIAQQLKRLADINYETLQFEIARFKFNNPGFQYNPPSL